MSSSKCLCLKRGLLLAVLSIILTGCMTDSQARRLDERFAAGWRPSKGYCAFGGPTPTLDAYCASVNFGDEGVVAILRSENARILATAQGGSLSCTEHVAMAKAALRPRQEQLQLTELYSCDRDAPVVDGRKVCHVSLMVTDKDTGVRVVMDNGHVLNPHVTRGVAEYTDFKPLVAYTWTGAAPFRAQLGSR